MCRIKVAILNSFGLIVAAIGRCSAALAVTILSAQGLRQAEGAAAFAGRFLSIEARWKSPSSRSSMRSFL